MASSLIQALNATIIAQALSVLTPKDYESKIVFYGWNSERPSERFISSFNSSISDQGCDPNGNFSMIVHGWTDTLTNRPWAPILISNFLQYRDGCVFFMDYSEFSNTKDYLKLVLDFRGISAVLLKKLKQIGHYDDQFLFGFSFGARLCEHAGLKIGNQQLNRMDLCDPAGPGFDNFKDPKQAAKFVGCINTSTDKGTNVYKCHHNYRMGSCGDWQAGATSYPIGSHGMCPYLYNLAFKHNFVPNNFYNCKSNRMVKEFKSNVKLGYLADFDRSAFVGDVFIATAKYPPYVVVNDVIDNRLENLLEHFETCRS